jgi:carbamoyl-phosphate synthase large subunit
MTAILVMGISGNVSLGMLRVLRKNFPDYNLIGSCIYDSFSNHFCDEFYKSPLASSENFIEWFINLCNTKNIDIVFSGVEEIIEVLALNQEIISKSTNCKLTFSSKLCLEIGKSKLATVEWLKNNNFRYPSYCLPRDKNDIVDFYKKLNKPIILKPIFGKGSKGISKYYSLDEVRFSNLEADNYIAQEIIGSEHSEYTVGCYQNLDGYIVEPIIFKRELLNGHTIKAEIIKNSKISEYCKEITYHFNPFGPLNIQLRLDDNDNPVAFEMNVRFSGTTLIRDFFGFKDVVSMVHEKLNAEFEILNFNALSEGYCIRMLDEFFFENPQSINLDNVVHYE